MENEWRNKNKISRASLGDKLQFLAPAHARLAAGHINDAFQLPMMMGRRFGARMNVNRARPKFVRSSHRSIDCRRPRHAGCLRRIEVELSARNNFDSVISPISDHKDSPRYDRLDLTHHVTIDILAEFETQPRFRRHDEFTVHRHGDLFEQLEGPWHVLDGKAVGNRRHQMHMNLR